MQEMAAMARVPSLHTLAAYEAAIRTHETVVVDWYAPWCGKCQQMGPFVEKLMDDYGGDDGDDVAFFKANVTEGEMEALSQVLPLPLPLLLLLLLLLQLPLPLPLPLL